jgi:hypothetical protein
MFPLNRADDTLELHALIQELQGMMEVFVLWRPSVFETEDLGSHGGQEDHACWLWRKSPWAIWSRVSFSTRLTHTWKQSLCA